MPQDEEYMWNNYTNEQVHKWFSENFDERSYIIGKVRVCQIIREKYLREGEKYRKMNYSQVRLHLGNTIWLDDLKIGTKLIGYPDLIGSSLKKQLLFEKFAVLNNDHLSNLFKLCKNSGLTKINGHDISTTCK